MENNNKCIEMTQTGQQFFIDKDPNPKVTLGPKHSTHTPMTKKSSITFHIILFEWYEYSFFFLTALHVFYLQGYTFLG